MERKRSADNVTRLIGAGFKSSDRLSVTDVDTFDRWGTVTFTNGQIFRFEVTELDAAEVAAKAAERPGDFLKHAQ